MSSLVKFLLAVASLTLLATPVVVGQAGAPELTLTPASGAVELADNQTRDLVWTVTNAGATATTVEVTVTAPSGWHVELVAGSGRFSLPGNLPVVGGGGSRALQAVLSLEPGARPGNGTLTVQATGTNAAGQTGTATATVTLTYLPPPPPPVVPYNPWPLALGVTGGVLLLAALGAYLWSATRLRLQLSALAIEEHAGARGTLFLLVHNRARKARRIDLRLQGLPAPWSGALMVPHVLLDADGTTEIPLSVSVPRQAQGGDGCQFQVQARPHGWYPWLARRGIRAIVLGDSKAIVPGQSPPIQA